MPGHARRRRRRARRVRGDARGGRARALGRRADVHRGGHAIAPRRTRPPTIRARTSTSSASRRRSANECVGRYERYLRRLGVLGDATAEEIKNEALEVMRAGIAEAEAEPDAGSRARVRQRLRRSPPPNRPRRAGMAELFMVEAINDALPRRARPRRLGDGDGRGRRPRRRRLPRDGRAARPVRREPLRRHAARRGGDPRQRGRALHGRLAAGLRDAVRRVLVSVPRPADHARRPLPLAHRREDGVPARRADAVRRRRARARAARRLAGGVLRPHARREGRDPVDAGRREGAARRGDPRSRSRRRARAEAHLPRREAARCPRASTSCRSARRGSRARGRT